MLSQEEVCGLHLPPPWKVRGNTLRYGLGLLSSYFVCDLLTVLSDSYFYVFDPLGLTSSGVPSSAGGSAKLFSLKGEVFNLFSCSIFCGLADCSFHRAFTIFTVWVFRLLPSQ
jgi:hypothetical protein